MDGGRGTGKGLLEGLLAPPIEGEESADRAAL